MVLLLAKWLPHFYVSLFFLITPNRRQNIYILRIVSGVFPRCGFAKGTNVGEFFSFLNPKICVVHHFLMTHSMRLRHSIYSIFYNASQFVCFNKVYAYCFYSMKLNSSGKKRYKTECPLNAMQSSSLLISAWFQKNRKMRQQFTFLDRRESKIGVYRWKIENLTQSAFTIQSHVASVASMSS